MPRTYRYSCDHGFFEVIDSEAKAYWLGFLAADGYVRPERGVLMVRLAVKDADHVVRLREALHSDHAIQEYLNRTYGGAFPYRLLQIRSDRLCAALVRLGVDNRKTTGLRWPELPADLLRHYLRGYFDGDGSFTLGSKRWRAYSNMSFSVLGPEAFVRGCMAYLRTTLGLRETRLSRKRPTDPYATMFYCGRIQVSRIWHLLYDGATVYLPRKREVLAPYVL